jgi:hypothetical protein
MVTFRLLSITTGVFFNHFYNGNKPMSVSTLTKSLCAFRIMHGVGVAFLLALPLTSNAVYNANMAGVVTVVAAYADADYLYSTLINNQPTSHPVCNPTYFVIPQDIPENRRNQMYAQLLISKTTGEPVNIGFDIQLNVRTATFAFTEWDERLGAGTSTY